MVRRRPSRRSLTGVRWVVLDIVCRCGCCTGSGEVSSRGSQQSQQQHFSGAGSDSAYSCLQNTTPTLAHVSLRLHLQHTASQLQLWTAFLGTGTSLRPGPPLLPPTPPHPTPTPNPAHVVVPLRICSQWGEKGCVSYLGKCHNDI